ncbi:hypothetical protein K474DRAFT_1567303, partial [Panus rudis PR-1116 ss-1]
RDGDAGKHWIDVSKQASHSWQRGPHHARVLRKWTRAFLADRHNLPYTPSTSAWRHSLIERPALREAIIAHLQSIGKYVRALDIVDFLARPDIQRRHGLTKTIALSTAQEWMHALSYRWGKTPSGQFVDGHERDDVVHYRQTRFLP